MSIGQKVNGLTQAHWICWVFLPVPVEDLCWQC